MPRELLLTPHGTDGKVAESPRMAQTKLPFDPKSLQLSDVLLEAMATRRPHASRAAARSSDFSPSQSCPHKRQRAGSADGLHLSTQSLTNIPIWAANSTQHSQFPKNGVTGPMHADSAVPVKTVQTQFTSLVSQAGSASGAIFAGEPSVHQLQVSHGGDDTGFLSNVAMGPALSQSTSPSSTIQTQSALSNAVVHGAVAPEGLLSSASEAGPCHKQHLNLSTDFGHTSSPEVSPFHNLAAHAESEGSLRPEMHHSSYNDTEYVEGDVPRSSFSACASFLAPRWDSWTCDSTGPAAEDTLCHGGSEGAEENEDSKEEVSCAATWPAGGWNNWTSESGGMESCPASWTKAWPSCEVDPTKKELQLPFFSSTQPASLQSTPSPESPSRALNCGWVPGSQLRWNGPIELASAQNRWLAKEGNRQNPGVIWDAGHIELSQVSWSTCPASLVVPSAEHALQSANCVAHEAASKAVCPLKASSTEGARLRSLTGHINSETALETVLPDLSKQVSPMQESFAMPQTHEWSFRVDALCQSASASASSQASATTGCLRADFPQGAYPEHTMQLANCAATTPTTLPNMLGGAQAASAVSAANQCDGHGPCTLNMPSANSQKTLHSKDACLPKSISFLQSSADHALQTGGPDICYQVCFTRNPHKKWRHARQYEGGIVRVRQGKAALFNEEGKQIVAERTLPVPSKLMPGAEVKLSQILVEVEAEIAVGSEVWLQVQGW